MLSLDHEILVALLRNSPALACDLARRLDATIPAADPICVSESKLTEIVPTEYSADLVLLLGPETKPDFGLVVEVQLRADERKRYSWPVYATALRARYRCPSCVLVVALDPRVARWAAQPIELGQPESSFVPLVLGAEGVPAVTDGAAARSCPELGVLSALVHNDKEDVARAALAGAAAVYSVDEAKATLYNDLVWRALSERALGRLEAEMDVENYEVQSEFALRHIAKGREEGREQGREEGREMARQAVLAVLEARGMPAPDGVRSRIESCRDLDLLATWHKRAIEAESPEDIFAD